jgi:hypothetical protein
MFSSTQFFDGSEVMHKMTPTKKRTDYKSIKGRRFLLRFCEVTTLETLSSVVDTQKTDNISLSLSLSLRF